MTKPIVEVYARKDCALCALESDCALCKEALEMIGRVNTEIPFDWKEVDIDASEDLMRRFREDLPTIYINGKKAFKYKVDEAEFRKKIRKEIIKAGLSRLSKSKKSC